MLAPLVLPPLVLPPLLASVVGDEPPQRVVVAVALSSALGACRQIL